MELENWNSVFWINAVSMYIGIGIRNEAQFQGNWETTKTALQQFRPHPLWNKWNYKSCDLSRLHLSFLFSGSLRPPTLQQPKKLVLTLRDHRLATSSAPRRNLITSWTRPVQSSSRVPLAITHARARCHVTVPSFSWLLLLCMSPTFPLLSASGGGEHKPYRSSSPSSAVGFSVDSDHCWSRP